MQEDQIEGCGSNADPADGVIRVRNQETCFQPLSTMKLLTGVPQARYSTPSLEPSYPSLNNGLIN